MAFKYMTRDILNGFDKYKYSSIDTSPVSTYITHPFWNWVVEFYPRWFAPNVLTFVGFLFLVVQFAVLTYYDFHFYASDFSHPEHPAVPNWVWLLSALCMFWAHTLDGTDGKQARRTKTSSPLGELFDHGLDSWATLFIPVGMYSVFGRVEYGLPPDRVFYVLLAIWSTFIISHWEKYNTGILFLPWGYDISQITMTMVYLATFIGGYQMWKLHIPLWGITMGQLFEIVMFLSVFAFSIPMSLWNVYVGYRDKSGKNLSLYESVRPLLSSVALIMFLHLWGKYTSIDIIKKHPRLFYVACGTVFSNITCRLIVSGMSNTRAQVFNWLLLPLFFIVTGVMTMSLGIIELYLLWAFTIFVTAAHVHYGICVVQQLADHLNIHIFSIQKRPK